MVIDKNENKSYRTRAAWQFRFRVFRRRHTLCVGEKLGTRAPCIRSIRRKAGRDQMKRTAFEDLSPSEELPGHYLSESRICSGPCGGVSPTKRSRSEKMEHTETHWNSAGRITVGLQQMCRADCLHTLPERETRFPPHKKIRSCVYVAARFVADFYQEASFPRT